MEHGSRRAIVAAFLANLGIAVAKLIAYVATGAASMLAESIHSLADTGNQALLLLGSKRGQRAPTAEHPFGYGRERYFWAFVVALVLFSLGSVFAIVEGVHKLQHPEPLESPQWAIGTLVVAVLLEGYSFRTAIREARHSKGKETWWGFVKTAKSPELPVVLLEDLGALFGLVFALVGVSLAVITGEPRYDALGSVVIGALLGVIAVILAIEMKSLLVGEAASAAQQLSIREGFEGAKHVRRLIHMRTMHLGPEELLVAAKLEFEPSLSLRELADAIDAAESSVRDRVPSARLIFVEPDVYRGA